MAIYKFRVTFEDHDDVSRDIEIKSIQSFEDLQKAIHQCIGYDTAGSASFYMSDDYWKKGKEISSLEKTDKQGKNVPLLAGSKLCDFIIDPHQKIYYVFDGKTHWSFFIELMKIQKDEAGVQYPRTVKTTGEAPKQYGVSTLGKVSTDLDFFNEVGLDVPEEGEDGMEVESESEEGVEEEADEFGVEEEEGSAEELEDK